MPRMVKLLAVTLVIGALLFGAAFGFANTLDVTGVDNLGSGDSLVGSPPAVDDVQWIISGGNYTAVEGVTLTFASTGLSANSAVYVMVYSDNAATIELGKGANTTASGNTVIVTLDNIVEAELIKSIRVTVLDH